MADKHPALKGYKCIACKQTKFTIRATFTHKIVVSCNSCKFIQDITTK